jgi:hypothetical protein
MQEVQKAAAQKEMASTISDMENTFKGILATVGGALMPLFEILGPVLKVAFMPLKIAAKLLQFVLDGIMWFIKKIPFLGKFVEGVGNAFNTFDQAVTNFSVAGLEGGGMGSVVEAGDVISPAGGQTMISTKEGGLLKLSSNDDVVAAPGAANAIGGGSSLAALAAPLNTMIGELKALRADLAAGKIAVRMDGAKVSAGIGTVVEGSTRNNYAMAQG